MERWEISRCEGKRGHGGGVRGRNEGGDGVRKKGEEDGLKFLKREKYQLHT